MQFYQAQDQARKNTKWLVLLFILSIVSLILIANLLITLAFSHGAIFGTSQTASLSGGFFSRLFNSMDLETLAWVSLAVCSVVGLATLFKWSELKAGGHVIAESLGGQKLAPNSDVVNERRLLNVVEEMALAAGLPVPPVYVMRGEMGVNAFAAGWASDDAVIGVTEGTLAHLNRDQLQGVIAHEFSHILNGDMRLNIKLIAILHGILMIGEVGHILLHSSSHSSYGSRRNAGKNAAVFLALGVALMAIGFMGQLFGGLIKSGVSRQREFLADASAVQFTRNPQGIGDALRIIGGFGRHSRVDNASAHELGHMFFGSAYNSMFSLFATHPPLDERIEKVLPAWDGSYLQPEPPEIHQEVDKDKPIEFTSALSAVAIAGAAVVASTSSQEQSGEPKAALDLDLRKSVRDPEQAVALILALLMSKEKETKSIQMSAIGEASAVGLGDSNVLWQGQAEKCEQQLEVIYGLDIPSESKLALIELSVPAIKSLSKGQYGVFRSLLTKMSKADGKVDLFEWTLFNLVCQYCDVHFGMAKVVQPRYSHLKQVSEYYQVVLSMLVHYGTQDEDTKTLAFNRACNASGFYTLSLVPDGRLSLKNFSDASRQLAYCYPLLKPRLINGLVKCAQTDSHINDKERYLVTAVAAIMDSPLVGLEIR